MNKVSFALVENIQSEKKLINLLNALLKKKENIIIDFNNKIDVKSSTISLLKEFELKFEQIDKSFILVSANNKLQKWADVVIPTIKEIIKRKIPIFGICLGHQILSLALGAKTKKMFQGHRGGNHPVKNLDTSIVEITSQNHGFEVDKSSLPKDVLETHISLFDGTNEGIKHKSLPIFSVQYHPEASPGPHDSHYLFKNFYSLVKEYAKKK